MTCEQYNLVKEGDLRNVVSSEVFELDLGAINALYDGDISTTAVTISGTPRTIGLVAEFGESYDICYVDYYTDESDIDSISISYGVTSGIEETAVVTLEAAGKYRGTINRYARFVELRHTVSGTAADIKQLEIVGTKNETLGFGQNKATEVDKMYLPHSTAGTLSASPTPVPLFNDNHFDDVARIAVAPTFTSADNYIHIATTSSGTYYGIDDYGFRQPGSDPIPLVDDPMNSDMEIGSQWVRRTPARGHKSIPTQEGIVFEITSGDSFGGVSEETTGLLSREFFTATSFTAEVQIQFLEFFSNSPAKDFFFVLANGYPLPDSGYVGNFQGDARRGTSTGGVAMRVISIGSQPGTDTFKFFFRYVDGRDSDNPFSSTVYSFTGGTGDGIGLVHEQGGISMDTMTDIANEGATLGDFTAAAKWHTWRISYDHVRQELSGYVDNIFLGSYLFRFEDFKGACKLFVGFHGEGGVKWALRNFRILPNKVYRHTNVALAINGGLATATVSGIAENTAKLIDGDTSTAYVGPEPTALARVRVDFDQPYDIAYYRLKQRSQGTGTSAFGKTYYPDVARTAVVDFGGQNTYTHLYSNTSSYVYRSPSFSETAVTLSGISYLDLQFVDYDETAQTNGALVIEQLEVIAEGYVDATPPPAEDSKKIPWVEGRWKNLKQYGTSGALAIKDKISPEVAYWPFPEYAQQFVDFGFSSAVNGRQNGSSVDYHHTEALFFSPYTTAAGTYRQWHSEVQSEPEPFYIWRYFTEESTIGAVYWNSDTLRPSNVADSFKFQYLASEGDPNDETAWVDIPPVVLAHTDESNSANRFYKEHKDYLIANNDGEYYTDYFNLPKSSIGLGFIQIGNSSGLDTVVPNGYGYAYIVNQSYDTGTANGLWGYVEFDEPPRTRGIRMVVKNPSIESGWESGASSSTPGLPRYDFALENLRIFRTHGAGSYTGPVFDTGTPQNTERVKTSLRAPEGSSAAIFVRSSSEPPSWAYDPEYETWRKRGEGGNRDFSFPSSPNHWDRAIVLGDKAYHILSSAPLVYDIVKDSWSQENGIFPSSVDYGGDSFVDDGSASTASPGIEPDDRVNDHSVLLDGIIYTAAYDTGSARSPRFMKLEFSGTAVGWRTISDQRPLFSEYASMAGLNRRLYFFNQDGEISYYDIDLANWVSLDVIMPTSGSQRLDMASVVWEGKVYLFGGRDYGQKAVSIFDPDAESFSIGTAAPKEMRGHQAIAVPEERIIYLLPIAAGYTSSYHAAMKYYPDEDRWEFAESMMWSRATGGLGLGNYYYYHDGYIYRTGDTDYGQCRTLVRKPTWSHGKTPDLRDPVWGAAATLRDLPWKSLGDYGELMPQERYFQFKVELYSDDQANTPVLEDVRIVLPQSITVPASGTVNAYVRIGVSEEGMFQAWYSGERGDGGSTGDYSILYFESGNGLTWGYPATASGVVEGGLSDYGVHSPWVIKNSEDSYVVWFTREQVGVVTNLADIYRNTFSDPSNLSGGLAQQVITNGVVSQTEAGVFHPCVVVAGTNDYRLWYTGKDTSGVTRIFYTTSSGGVAWTGHQLVIDRAEDGVTEYDAQEVFRPCVLLENGTYRMWYAATDSGGTTRILYRESSNGVDWGEIGLNVGAGSEGTHDRFGATKPYILEDAGTYHLYYLGWDGSVHTVLHATSPAGRDWVNFVPVLPPYGVASIRAQGHLDSAGIGDFFALVNRNTVIPGEVITTGKIKIHNEGASL